MTIKEEIDRAAPVLDRVNDAIRENPLAAGLIGAGVAWMLFGAKGFSTMGGLAKGAGAMAASAADVTGSTAASIGRAALDASSTASSALKHAVSDGVGTVASIVPDMSVPDAERVANATSDIGSTVSNKFQTIVSSGREYGSVLQSRLSEGLEQQPLMLGALGLAIGAGIASTFATTETENVWMGDKSAAAREGLQDVVQDLKDRGRQVASAVQEEAARQGLTEDAAKDAAKTVVSKASNVARAVRDAVVQSPKSKP
jgi:hypothetical protein